MSNVDFIYPTDTRRITTGFTMRWGEHHNGIDFANPGYHPIYASASGTVRRSYTSTSYGECIMITHYINGKTWETVYAHMKSGSRKVFANQHVNQGDVIGVMGSTGHSTGQHLHFELHKNGKWNIDKSNAVDPMDYLGEDNSEDIKSLQRKLIKAGYDLPKYGADGVMGDETKSAIRVLQVDYGCKVDGIFGKETKKALEKALRGELTVSQYEELKNKTVSQYEELKNKLNSIQESLNNKLDKPNKGDEPYKTHEPNWNELKDEDVTKGNRPHDYATREQVGTMLIRFYEEMVEYPDGQEPYQTHASNWEWLINEGITKGGDPHKPLTREQSATLLRRFYEVFVEPMYEDEDKKEVEEEDKEQEDDKNKNKNVEK